MSSKWEIFDTFNDEIVNIVFKKPEKGDDNFRRFELTIHENLKSFLTLDQIWVVIEDHASLCSLGQENKDVQFIYRGNEYRIKEMSFCYNFDYRDTPKKSPRLKNRGSEIIIELEKGSGDTGNVLRNLENFEEMKCDLWLQNERNKLNIHKIIMETKNYSPYLLHFILELAYD